MTAEERARRIVSLPPFLDYIPVCREEVVRAITAAIEEEREACRSIAQAEMERMRQRQIDRDGRGDMFRQGITQGGGQMAALIEVIIRNRSKQKGVEEK